MILRLHASVGHSAPALRNLLAVPDAASRAPASSLRDPQAMLALVLVAAVLLALAAAVWWDWRRSGYSLGVYAAFRPLWLYVKLWQGARPRRPDPLPATGPVILVSNHTSPVDPALLQCATRRVISFLMAREYFGIWALRPVFRLIGTIPVNRTGRDTGATKAALRAIHEGRVIGIFPEGGIHLDPDTLGAAKPGAAMLALTSRAPVVPAFIERRQRTNRIFEGVVRPGRARVWFGPPLDLSPYYERRHDRGVLSEVSRLMMQAIAALSARRDRSSSAVRGR